MTSSYGWLSFMANASNFQIGCLNAESHNERMISIGNNVVTEGNTLLSGENIDMLVVLHIYSELMDSMQSKYGNFSRQKFNVTIVRYDGEEYSVVEFDF